MVWAGRIKESSFAAMNNAGTKARKLLLKLINIFSHDL